MAHSWNFSEWLDNLGLKRPDQPELIHAVQPVEIVGDHSGWTSQILPPMAWTGGQRAAVAAVYSGLQLTSRSAGGTYLRWLEVSTANNLPFNWHLTTTPGAMANTIANTYSQMGSVDTVSTLTIGTFAALPAVAGTVPIAEVLGTVSRSLPDIAFIPPGASFELWIPAVNNLLGCAVMFEDNPAQRSER